MNLTNIDLVKLGIWLVSKEFGPVKVKVTTVTINNVSNSFMY